MMEKPDEKIEGYVMPQRFSCPEDEKIYPWLPMLLDAYHVIDSGVAAVIEMEKQKNRGIACFKGCSNCCMEHKTIPIYPLELVGITWYAAEKIKGDEREILKRQLVSHKRDDACPFLIEDACSIHNMRPISCRQFIVFEMPCSAGEDPYYTRREDVLLPIKEYTDRAFFIMLPFYGLEDESDRLEAIGSGAMHKVVCLLHDCNWKSLADRMDEFDKKSA